MLQEINVAVEAQFVELMVPLYSYGCGKKIKKALAHFKGIYSVNVDYEQQKVSVWGICNKNEVLSTIRAKRKGACFWKQHHHHHHGLSSVHTAPPSPSSSSSFRRVRPSLISIKQLGHAVPLSLNWKAAWKKLKVFSRSNSF